MGSFPPEAHLLLGVSGVPRGKQRLQVLGYLQFSAGKGPSSGWLGLVLSGGLENSKEMQSMHRHKGLGPTTEGRQVRRGV